MAAPFPLPYKHSVTGETSTPEARIVPRKLPDWGRTGPADIGSRKVEGDRRLSLPLQDWAYYRGTIGFGNGIDVEPPVIAISLAHLLQGCQFLSMSSETMSNRVPG